MFSVMPRSLWVTVAILGVCAVVQTVAQDSPPRPGLPPLPPLPQAPAAGANGSTPPAASTPVPVRPKMVVPMPNHRPEPTYGQPPMSTQPATPAYTQPTPRAYPQPTPPTQSAPAPAAVPHGAESHAPSAAPEAGTGPYSHSTEPIRPRPYHAGYQPDHGIDPSLYYDDGSGWGGSYPNPVGAPYYWGYGASMGGHVRYPYYSYRRPWYNPGPAVHVFDTNIHW